MSYQSILAELPDDFIRKMRNWARSNLGGGNYAMTTAYDGSGPSSGYAETRIPVLNGEAEDVDSALCHLPNRYRQAVMLFWSYEGRPLTWLARRLHCEYRAVERRIIDGHLLLRAELAKQRSAHTRYHEGAKVHISA